MIKVLIVDDHALVRAGLRVTLAGAAGIEVVGDCRDGADVPDAMLSMRPDVIVMDVRMRRIGGIEATHKLLQRQPSARVLVVSGLTATRVVDDAVAAGAAGFIVKGVDAAAVVAAVRTIAAGGSVWPESLCTL
ncbi:MAG: degU [Acidimicrobiales bacterium]|nr:degU [Acidimicrobiales bacterium]